MEIKEVIKNYEIYLKKYNSDLKIFKNVESKLIGYIQRETQEKIETCNKCLDEYTNIMLYFLKNVTIYEKDDIYCLINDYERLKANVKQHEEGMEKYLNDINIFIHKRLNIISSITQKEIYDFLKNNKDEYILTLLLEYIEKLEDEKNINNEEWGTYDE